MPATPCSKCQAEIPEDAVQCPACGAAVVKKNGPVSPAPAFAGITLFVVVLLISEWVQSYLPTAIAGILLLAFLVVKYGKLAYVQPAPPQAKIEAEVPVAQLLEKVEVSGPEVPPAAETAICPKCGVERTKGRFCGNCGEPYPV